MITREAIAARILQLCKEKNITINGIANLSAIPPSTINNIIYGVSKNPGIVTIKMISDTVYIPSDTSSPLRILLVNSFLSATACPMKKYNGRTIASFMTSYSRLTPESCHAIE